jgi:hypothetical protein
MISQSHIQELRGKIASGRAQTAHQTSVAVPRDLLEQMLDQIEVKQSAESQRRRAEQTPTKGAPVVPPPTPAPSYEETEPDAPAFPSGHRTWMIGKALQGLLANPSITAGGVKEGTGIEQMIADPIACLELRALSAICRQAVQAADAVIAAANAPAGSGQV